MHTNTHTHTHVCATCHVDDSVDAIDANHLRCHGRRDTHDANKTDNCNNHIHKTNNCNSPTSN